MGHCSLTTLQDEILVLEKPEILSAELEPLRVVNGRHRIAALKSLIDEKRLDKQKPSVGAFPEKATD